MLDRYLMEKYKNDRPHQVVLVETEEGPHERLTTLNAYDQAQFMQHSNTFTTQKDDPQFEIKEGWIPTLREDTYMC